MAGSSTARRFTDEDKARVLATLAANGDNVKRTARETGVLPATIRRWRSQDAQGNGPSPEKKKAAVTNFVQDAERVRNLALQQLEARVKSGDMKASELITTIGVLDDKIRLANGLATAVTEHRSTLPSADELRELMGGAVAAGIAAAERRHEEIVEAEIVEDRPGLPSPQNNP